MIRFVIFPHEDGRGFDVTIAGTLPPELAEIGRGEPFPTTGAARRAIRTAQQAMAKATISIEDRRPDDAEPE